MQSIGAFWMGLVNFYARLAGTASDMQITFPNKIAWRRPIESGPYFTSNSKQKKLTNLLHKVDKLDITYEIIDPDSTEGFYEWFTDSYAIMLEGKENPLQFDVASYTLTDGQQSAQKRALILTENGERIGATIFFLMRRSLNIAFKTYASRWSENHSLQIGPSLYSEYLLYEHAKSAEKEFISLGIDRNPYGPNADIGLATFKFSAGYRPRLVKNSKIETIDPATINKDTLIFSNQSNASGFITKAHLFAEDPEHYTMLLKKAKHIVMETVQL